MPTATLVSIFQAVTILGSALTVLKLYTSGLYRRYRIFFWYFVFRLPYMSTFLYLMVQQTNNSDTYFLFFIYTEPLILLGYILVVIELYSLVLEKYKGLYTVGLWAMIGSIVLATGISIVTMLVKLSHMVKEPSKRLSYEIALERGVDLAIVLFILFIVFFLSKFPVPMSRNVIVHTGVYSVFFLSETLVLLLRTLFGLDVNDTINTCLGGLSSSCALAWWWFLSAKGEEVQISVPHLNPAAEERILHQLDALNQTLMKVSRK